MTLETSRERRLTGRMVLGIALGAFGIVIAVNALLATLAVRTFSGLVVPNSYVASQTFDRDRNAQVGLGWTLAIDHRDSVLRLDLTNKAGAPVRPASLAVAVGRPAANPGDISATLVETPGGYAAPLALAPRGLAVEVDAVATNGTHFRQRRTLIVAAAPEVTAP